MARIKKTVHRVPPVEAGSSSQAQSHSSKLPSFDFQSASRALDVNSADSSESKGGKGGSVLASDGKGTTTIE